MAGRALPVLVWRAQALARRLWWRLADAVAGRPDPAPGIRSLEARLRARAAAATGPQGRRLTVGFLVCDEAKWSADPLFRLLRDAPDFDCGFLCTLSDTGLRLPRAGRAAEYSRQRAFFATLGEVWTDLYDPASDRILPATAIDCDILFIQQPWGMQDLPRQLAGRVLCAYVHYGFAVIRNDRMQFRLPNFHGCLWTYIAQTEAHRAAIMAPAPGLPRVVPKTVLVAGYPKLDAYLAPPPDRAAAPVWPNTADTARRRVIFAPHHAMGKGTLGMATFAWSAPAMLALARANPQVDFVLKPHPNLDLSLRRAGADPAAFLADWSTGNRRVYDGGAYFDLFRTSDALITDSGSFLAEYLPTGRPILRLVAPGTAGLNTSGQALADAFYEARDAESLRTLFDSVVLGAEDPLAGVRLGKIATIIPFAQPSSQIVLDYLRGCFLPAAGPSNGASGAAR